MPSHGVRADDDGEVEVEEDAGGCRRHERKAREKGERGERPKRRSETARVHQCGRWLSAAK